MQEIQKPQTLAKLPQIIGVVKDYVKTDMSLYEMSQYAAILKHLNIDDIEIATLPGAPNKHGYTSYWILDPDKTQEVVDRLIYRERVKNDKTKFAASVMYSNEYANEAKALINALNASNIEVKCTGTSNATHSQFIAHSKDVTNEYFNWLKKQVPDLNSKQFVYDPINYYCSNTDFTVVVSGQ